MCDRKLLTRGLNQLGVNLDDNAIDPILLYCQELLKWNKRINLIARNTQPAEVIEKHFLDSLTLLPVINQYGGANPTLLDIGTGAGFPGLVLAAVMPKLQVTLVEPRQKRVSFLRHIIRTLKLKNVQVIADRLENGDQLTKQQFTFITSRAVADAGRFLAMLQDIPDSETVVILMRATDDNKEWEGSTQGREWQIVENRAFTLPFSAAPRLLTLLQQVE